MSPGRSRSAHDAGLIIHENRFTYEAKGLKKIVDLGTEGKRAVAILFEKAAASGIVPAATDNLFL